MSKAWRSPGAAAPSKSRRRDLEAFLEASRVAGRPGNLDRALTTILDAAIGLVEADEGSIMMVSDDVSGGMRIVAARGLSETVRRQTVVLPGRGIAGTVLQNGRALLLPSPLDVSRFEGYVEKSRPIHSAICVPLRGNDKTIGVLNLNLVRRSDTFDDEDLTVANLFAEHAAIAISNSRRLGRSERTAQELEALRGAVGRLGRSLRLDTIVENALNEALLLARATSGLLVMASGTRVEVARYRGLGRDGIRDALRSPGFATLLSTREARIARPVATDPAFAALAPELGPQQLVIAPLGDGSLEGSSGLLAVAVPSGGEEIAGILASFAVEAGMAIANAALHEQVRVKEEELESIVEAIASPIILLDQRGVFRAINPAAAETFHLAPEFEIGQSVAGKIGEAVEELLLGQAEGTREVVLPVGGDPHVWRATVSTTRSGPLAGGRLLVLDDITLSRELEQRKSDFLAVIGHELRTPLTIIGGFAQTLTRAGVEMGSNERILAVETILEQSGRLGQMIEDLLYISRIENRSPRLHLGWHDISVKVNDIAGSFGDRYPTRSFAVRNSATAPQMLFDDLKVGQVLRHLIENAVKYSDDDTPVLIAIADDGDDVRICVEDKGVGIFSGDLPRLFKVFGQLDSSSTRRFGGTGIGLSVCKTLVDAMGGRIWAQSMLGKGSEFSFTIPKTPPSERS